MVPSVRTDRVAGGPDVAVPTPAERRLRGLVTAAASIMESLDLDVVLNRTVASAMQAVDARVGGLRLIAPDGTVDRDIRIGVDANRVGRVASASPEDGAPDEPSCERMPALATQEPSTISHLSIPIPLRSGWTGILQLAESHDDYFTDDDEALLTALAETAGAAVASAQMHESIRAREAWRAATVEVMSALLDDADGSALDLIADRVAAIMDARLVAVAVPQEEGTLLLAAAVGDGADGMRGRAFPSAGTLSARALALRRPVQSPSPPHPPIAGARDDIGQTIAIPLSAGGDALGVLTVSRSPGATRFTAEDLEMASVFAAHASVALQLVRARDDRHRLTTSRDRSRIVRDMHDDVIQRLFGMGLALQEESPGAAATTVDAHAAVIDEVIADIRTIVFALGDPGLGEGRRLRDRLLAVVSDASDGWRAPPLITFDGALDLVVDAALADDLVAALRDLLGSVDRHADATRVRVRVSASDELVSLEVHDHGRGLRAASARRGLARLAARARHHGGRSSVRSTEDGRIAVWSVPIRPRRAP
ncbi:GAF domain-containing protein [Microcella daejeonensis]|uniref:GAF domain-containing protein n=1 Tax=Microcella daejeonensis TaxID=2994971 RepID=A0A9E8S7R1_9MICO|nr:GAF domain-containing protein [Microcella daejeonensis]WAB80393.1 GAF domain-containing protein [Microcella daejeonensis]